MADDSIFERMGSWWRNDPSERASDTMTGAVVDAGDTITKADAVPSSSIGSSLSSSTELGGYAVSFDERKLNMIGDARWAEFDRMVRDISVVAASVRLFLNLVSNAVWTVNPPDDDTLTEAQKKQAQEYADAAYDDLFSMTSSWATVIRKIAMYRFVGFSIMEWTAKRKDDGSIGFQDIEHRPQRSIVRWLRDRSGTVEAIVQRVTGLPEVTLPRVKVVYAVDDTLTDHPEGMGLYRHLAETADRLREFLSMEEQGFATDLRGIPIARAPLGELQKTATNAGAAGTPEREKAEGRRARMLQPLKNFVNEHVRNKKTGLMLPSDTFISEGTDGKKTPSTVPKWGLELATGDSTSFADVASAIKRMNEELARVLGTEHLMLGADGVGSLALARSKVGTFYLTTTSTLLDIVEVCDRDLLSRWSELNSVPEELAPQMGVNEISDREIEQVMSVLKDLATAGAPILPDDPSVGEIYDLIGLTRPPERIDEMDLSLNPGRTAPGAPDDPSKPMKGNPEDKPVTKVLRSRTNMAKIAKRKAAR